MEISFGTDRLCGRCRDIGINLAPVPFVDIDRWQSRMQLGPPPHRPEAHNLLSCRYFRRPIQAGFGARNADPVLHFSRCSTDVSRFSAEACASLGISPTIAILVVGKILPDERARRRPQQKLQGRYLVERDVAHPIAISTLKRKKGQCGLATQKSLWPFDSVLVVISRLCVSCLQKALTTG
ncbi:hypothetical protein K438DRAFT_1987499 [Mycena galopus ATCC 62051]|nr:hypothetical protein K438DRAFT_1987499 [Mycena galopus ATCC 62051]